MSKYKQLDVLNQVAEFHTTFNHPILDTPTIPGSSRTKLRVDLLQEELNELSEAIHSKDLVEILFMHPYTKIEFLVDRLNITRKTASKYLNELENIGILENIQIKNSKYFINIELFNLLRKGI